MKEVEWMPLQRTGLAVRMDLLNEAQALKNHSQSLKQLKDRGGLSPCEALAIAKNKQWEKVENSLTELAKLSNY